MAILIDTNILLRSVQPTHLMHPVAVRAIEALLGGEELLCIAVQNVAEFWNAATRPVTHNGLGFTIEKAREEISRLEDFFQIVCESAGSYAAWKLLLTTHRVSGAQVHEARLAALMKTNGITKIVTFNVQDFTRFAEIEAVHPDKIV
jgi:predicted nucleic acid-binding protein